MDFNSDGHHDLILLASVPEGNSTQQYIDIWFGDSNGNYHRQVRQLAGSSHLVTGDLNNDGRLDIVTSSEEGLYISIQSTNGQLEAPIFNAYASCPGFHRKTGTGDFTGDGRADLVQFDGGYIHFYEQTAAGDLELYARAENAATSTNPAAYFADLDNDGDIDMVYGHTYQLNIYLHEGNSFTTVKLGLDHPQNWPESITAMDYNQDGAMDLVVPSQMITVFLGGLSPLSQAVQ